MAILDTMNGVLRKRKEPKEKEYKIYK